MTILREAQGWTTLREIVDDPVDGIRFVRVRDLVREARGANTRHRGGHFVTAASDHVRRHVESLAEVFYRPTCDDTVARICSEGFEVPFGERLDSFKMLDGEDYVVLAQPDSAAGRSLLLTVRASNPFEAVDESGNERIDPKLRVRIANAADVLAASMAVSRGLA